jgi:hypothetical protein
MGLSKESKQDLVQIRKCIYSIAVGIPFGVLIVVCAWYFLCPAIVPYWGIVLVIGIQVFLLVGDTFRIVFLRRRIRYRGNPKVDGGNFDER